MYWMRDLCGGLSKCKCDAVCGGKGDASGFITAGATGSISSDAEGVKQADKEGFGACSVGGCLKEIDLEVISRLNWDVFFFFVKSG